MFYITELALHKNLRFKSTFAYSKMEPKISRTHKHEELYKSTENIIALSEFLVRPMLYLKQVRRRVYSAARHQGAIRYFGINVGEFSCRPSPSAGPGLEQVPSWQNTNARLDSCCSSTDPPWPNTGGGLGRISQFMTNNSSVLFLFFLWPTYSKACLEGKNYSLKAYIYDYAISPPGQIFSLLWSGETIEFFVHT